MAFILFWMSLTILTSLLNALDGIRESVHSMPPEYSRSRIWWHPYFSLKEYQSFQDAKIYVLNVPEYTYEMKLSFHYQGMYLSSHKPCNNSINILLQHGSPAIPYQDEIQADGLLNYNNTDYCETSVSLSRPQNKNISSPLPGKWYVTAFLPYVAKVKKIKEKGLSKTDDKCLSALSIVQMLISPLNPPVVLAKGQPWNSTANPRFSTTTYYKYFVSSYSKELTVGLKNSCRHRQRNCLLKLSLSALSLPTPSSLSCIAPCTLNISWPQPRSYYYIEVNGTSLSYEITANHQECHSNAPECTEVTPMLILDRKNLENSWTFDLFNSTNVFSLKLHPDYVGTTLIFLVWPFHRTTGVTYKMCVTKDLLPFNEFSKKYCSEKSDGVLRMEFVYPQSGTWYVTVDVQSHWDLDSYLVFHAKTQTCLENCNKHGSCVIKSDIGVSYGLCECDYGYTGFTCSSYESLDILAVCLLTISNIAFIPGIVVACSRKFYPEAVVYLFNMYCSTMYHACDSHGYCIYDYDTLQLSDFYASILSVWFTLVTMIKLHSLWHRTLNILALLCLFIGVQLSRFGVLVTAVPGGIGLLFVLLSFGYRCRKRRKCFPSPKRWLIYLLPAFVLASTAIAIYTGLETTANYKYLHSVWHIAIASCIPLLLPSVRKPKLYVDYHPVNSDESFRDSDESLLMNVRNTTEHNDGQESEEITFPRLIT